VQGEEGISRSTVDSRLELILPGDGALVGEVRAPSSPRLDGTLPQRFGGRGMLKLGALSEGLEFIRRALPQDRIVGCLALGKDEAQAAQINALEMPYPPVLGQQ
jgi:hypothetical protein